MKEKPDLQRIKRDIEERYGINVQNTEDVYGHPALEFRIQKRLYEINLFYHDEGNFMEKLFYSEDDPKKWTLAVNVSGFEWGTGGPVNSMEELFRFLETDKDITEGQHLCPGLKPVQSMQLRLF